MVMESFKMKYLPSMEGMVSQHTNKKIIDGERVLSEVECDLYYKQYIREKRTVPWFAKWNGFTEESAKRFIVEYQAGLELA